MDRSLDSLSSAFKPKVFELLARLVERGLAVQIVETARTPAEAAANLAAGTSATSHSKHLPRRLRGILFASDPADLEKADAVDLCLYSEYELKGPDKLQWDSTDPAWAIIMEEAEKLDLRSGRRWHSPVDPGHVELIMSPADRALATEERQRPV